MISNQILQTTIDGMKSITRRDISIIERDGKIVASTEHELIGRYTNGMESFISSAAESQLIQGCQYFKVYDNNVSEYVVMIKGEDEETYRVGKITAFQIQNLLIAYKERFDRDNFIKNLLMDNLLLVDIYNRAKKLHISNDIPRVVFLIETDVDKELNILEIIRNMFPEKTKDFVTAIDERSIILIKDLTENEDNASISDIANSISDTLNTEALSKAYIGIGTTVTDLKNVSASYKEARMALEVGRIFGEDKTVMNYTQLGIGRLIYQLPTQLCKMYINEVLHGVSVDLFDDETLITVAKFFENHLNVSETSRQLYIHRNTLVYRLDKLQKLTGLDLRNFDDAIIFKITLMVSKYMKYKEKNTF